MNDLTPAIALARALADLDQACLDLKAPILGDFAGNLLDEDWESDKAWAYKQCGSADTWKKVLWLVSALAEGDLDRFRSAIQSDAEDILEEAETFLEKYEEQDEFDDFEHGDVRECWEAAKARLELLMEQSGEQLEEDERFSCITDAGHAAPRASVALGFPDECELVGYCDVCGRFAPDAEPVPLPMPNGLADAWFGACPSCEWATKRGNGR